MDYPNALLVTECLSVSSQRGSQREPVETKVRSCHALAQNPQSAPPSAEKSLRGRTQHVPPQLACLLSGPVCLLPSGPVASWLVLRSTGHAPTSGLSLPTSLQVCPDVTFSVTPSLKWQSTLFKTAVLTPPLVFPVLIHFILRHSIYHVLTFYLITLLFCLLSVSSLWSIGSICLFPELATSRVMPSRE